MMIYKYPIGTTDLQSVMMSTGAEILCVQVQGDTPCLWAIVDPDNEAHIAREIEIFGTGHPMDDHVRRYLGTYQLQSGSLIFHVFERT